MTKRKRKSDGFDSWQPDLFGGRHKERGEGRTRQEQMRFAREEMRDTGSRSLFELLDAHPKRRRNPSLEPLLVVGAIVGVAWWASRSQVAGSPPASAGPPPAGVASKPGIPGTSAVQLPPTGPSLYNAPLQTGQPTFQLNGQAMPLKTGQVETRWSANQLPGGFTNATW